YGEALIANSNTVYDSLFQSTREKAVEVANDIAVTFEDGSKAIDLGDQGRVAVEEFVEGIKSGKYKVNDVAIALINTMRLEMGKEPLTTEGIKVMNTFADGLKQMNVTDIATKLNLDLKKNLEIDLGPLGKMTSTQFVNGLKEGTVGIDAVFIFFQQHLSKLTATDLSQDGTKIMSTLKTGMEMGFIGVQDVFNKLGITLDDQTKYDLGPNGQFTASSLAQGLQNGQINIDTALEVIRQMVVQKTNIDTTQQGSNISQTTANGIASNTAPENAATGKKQAVEGIMGSTTDGGGGNKSGSELGQGIINQDGYIRGSALQVVASAHGAFNTINGSPAGNQGGQGFASGIVNQNGHIRGSALEAVTSAHAGFNNVNGTPHGQKGGSQFAQGMEDTKGQARSSGSNVAESGNSGLKSVSSISPGEAFSSGFASGISNGKWNVQNVAASLARGAFDALKATLNMNSPSRLTRDQGGKPFSEGFALGIQKTSYMAENESRTLGTNAYKSLVNTLKSNNLAFAGVQMAQGLAAGIKSQYSVVRDALQGSVTEAIDGIRSIKPEEIFSFQGDDPLTKYFNAIFVDGDWQNDWITHIPESMRDMVREIGRQMERFEGLSIYDVGNLSRWREVLSDNPNVIQYRPDNDNPDKGQYMPYSNRDLAQQRPLQIVIDRMVLAELLISPLELLQGQKFETDLYNAGVRR
ncbi:phage tail protein, partial [Bacillus toyonensis]